MKIHIKYPVFPYHILHKITKIYKYINIVNIVNIGNETYYNSRSLNYVSGFTQISLYLHNYKNETEKEKKRKTKFLSCLMIFFSHSLVHGFFHKIYFNPHYTKKIKKEKKTLNLNL